MAPSPTSQPEEMSKKVAGTTSTKAAVVQLWLAKAVAASICTCSRLGSNASGYVASATWVVRNPKTAMQSAQATVHCYAVRTKTQALHAVQSARWALQNPKAVASSAKARAIAAGTRAVDVASDRTVQATTASAAGGAVAMGSSGAAAGFLGGATVGAAMGIPAAFFTFGMSIPLGAAVGSCAGLCAGAAVGGGMGLVGGGAAGYGAYTKQDALKAGTVGSLANLKLGATNLRNRVVGRIGGKA